MKRALIGLVVLAVLSAAGVFGYLKWMEARVEAFGATAFGSSDARSVDLAPGSGPRTVAAALFKAGVISDEELGYQFVRKEGLGPKLKAGEYEFSGPLTPREVFEKLVRGQVKQYHFTVPEGLRVEEILPILASSELHLDPKKLNALASNTAFIHKAGVPADTLEGFLFPDTYSFTRGANEETVISKMVARALEEHGKAPRKAGVTLNLLEAMTLASIVEKETGAVEERPRISCVFHNRLRLGIKLQTDPTVLYAMAKLRGTFTKNITKADLETDHPYNTYTRKGLPPGPIASPGGAAIAAALSPIECNDLFFVSRNDGTHVFCPDLKCHEANVEKWQVEFHRNAKKKKGH